MDSFTLLIERLSLQCGIIKPRKKGETMKVKRVQDYISKDWFDETDGSYFERLNSRLQVLLRKDYPDLKGNDFISNISLLDL